MNEEQIKLGLEITELISNELKNRKFGSIISILQVRFGLTRREAREEVKKYRELHKVSKN